MNIGLMMNVSWFISQLMGKNKTKLSTKRYKTELTRFNVGSSNLAVGAEVNTDELSLHTWQNQYHFSRTENSTIMLTYIRSRFLTVIPCDFQTVLNVTRLCCDKRRTYTHPSPSHTRTHMHTHTTKQVRNKLLTISQTHGIPNLQTCSSAGIAVRNN